MEATIRVSETLGQGRNSVGLMKMGDAIVRDNVGSATLEIDNTQLLYVDSYQSLYDYLGVDIQASFKGVGTGGSTQISFARSVRMSHLSIFLMLKKEIFTTTYRLVNPTLDEDAARLLDASPEEFLRMFGDQFVSRIIMGGCVYLLVKIEASSEEEHRRMRAAASGSYGSVEGSIEVNQQLERISRGNRLELQAHRIGAEEAAPSQRPEENAFNYIDRVFDYMNNYRSKLINSLGGEILLEYSPYRVAEGRTKDPLTLSEARRRITESVQLREAILARQSVVEYALANPHRFPSETKRNLRQKNSKLSAQYQELESYVSELFATPADFRHQLPFDSGDLPAPPVPVEIIDIPLQVTIRGRGLHNQTYSVSGSEGVPIEMPLAPLGGAVKDVTRVYLNEIEWSIVSFEKDIRVVCQANLAADQQPSRLYSGSRSVGRIGNSVLSQILVRGVRFYLEGADRGDYTISYRAAIYDMRSWAPPCAVAWTPYASDGEPVGNMASVEVIDPMIVAGLEMRLEART